MRVLTTVALFGLKCDFQLEIEACLSTQLLNVKYDEIKGKHMLTTRWTAGSNFDYVKLNIFEEKNRGPSLSRQRQTFSLFLF